MSTVSEVITFLETLAPPELGEDWDNVGLLVGRRSAFVSKAMTCLTLTPDVADEATANGVQLIVSHHPVLFRGAKKITDATSEGRMLLKLIENGVAVFSPHTCFDSAALGVNQQLAESFELEEIRPIRPNSDGSFVGSGRVGCLPVAISIDEFLARVKEAVGATYLEFCAEPDATVSTVAVACGAAGDFLSDAKKLGCDTFVTGETRFHSALDARTSGLNLIVLGHYCSERPAVESLANVLQETFPGVDVVASQVESDPLSKYPNEN